jgi:acyl-coenzyme A thioesterase PaaI-like protein
MMEKLQKLVEKARTSPMYLHILNRVLWGVIPFNKPHRLRIIRLEENTVEIRIPYKRANLNHLKGIHACALATVSEYAAGFSLLLGLGTNDYRLIMKKLEMEYFYQGKTDCVARFSMSAAQLREQVILPLQQTDAIFVPCIVEVHDVHGNLVSTGKTEWQIKRWDKVKTKI